MTENLIVCGKYKVEVEISEENFRNLKNAIIHAIGSEAYVLVSDHGAYYQNSYATYHTNSNRSLLPVKGKAFGNESHKSLSMVLEFQFQRLHPSYLEDKLTVWDNVKRVFGKSETDLLQQKYHDQLRSIIEKAPVKITCDIKTDENTQEYIIAVRAVPACVWQKDQQGQDYMSSSSEIISHSRQKIQTIISKVGAEHVKWDKPVAKTREILSTVRRNQLKDFEYGNYIIVYLSAGNELFVKDYFHAALSSYIHCIEWIIIAYLAEKQSTNLLEAEKERGERYSYYTLVDRVKPELDQITYDKLKDFNSSERRWIAHHKSGKVHDHDLERVRIIIKELVNQLLHD